MIEIYDVESHIINTSLLNNAPLNYLDLLIITKKWIYLVYLWGNGRYEVDQLLLVDDNLEYVQTINQEEVKYKTAWLKADTTIAMRYYRTRKKLKKINPKQYLTHSFEWLRKLIKNELS